MPFPALGRTAGRGRRRAPFRLSSLASNRTDRHHSHRTPGSQRGRCTGLRRRTHSAQEKATTTPQTATPARWWEVTEGFATPNGKTPTWTHLRKRQPPGPDSPRRPHRSPWHCATIEARGAPELPNLAGRAWRTRTMRQGSGRNYRGFGSGALLGQLFKRHHGSTARAARPVDSWITTRWRPLAGRRALSGRARGRSINYITKRPRH